MEYTYLYIDKNNIKVYNNDDEYVCELDYYLIGEILLFESSEFILRFDDIVDLYSEELKNRNYEFIKEGGIKITPFLINDIEPPEYFIINSNNEIEYLNSIQDMLNIMDINEIMKFYNKYY